MIADIEEALVAQWSLFGRWPRGGLHDENGLLWYENPIRHLPYNGVLKTRLADADAEVAIAELCERFRSRGVDFLWFEMPDKTPANLAEHLARNGVMPAERVRCMALDLDRWRAPDAGSEATFEEVVDDAGLDAYARLTNDYWEVPEQDRPLVIELQRYWDYERAPGHRYLVRLDGRVVGKGYLSLAGPRDVAAIFGMFILPEARGHGAASGLARALVERAREAGRSRVVLHSTEMAAGLYRRLGFSEHCEMIAHATSEIWSADH